ncbi:hypothetical protein [Treponema saccharophilum]|uniref:Uncharacterized protein n=1 Tax=Treponema saccharophilum DSM 2985 TaxID=907348 RepID=H7EPP8_9SPIR|nr:hypothetical protein [Treponema saccharophilum]EIC00449.1 hypothetical protein TresaDRAFT_0543 [Treponema saccharophilum DSM 2985]BDC94985.1 hypothetical protein TRSA_00840 [Treponema saccharophilum]
MKFRRKETVEAVQWTGKNQAEVKAFAGQFAMFDFADVTGDGALDPVLKVKSREKISAANAGDYIVRGPKGDFFIEKKADFERDWEQA